jgi:hypothetical protein
LAGKIKRRLRPIQKSYGFASRFLPVALNFIYPVLFLVEDYKYVSRHAILLSKGLFTLS